jgi:glucan-binding YG repeat protein
MATGWINVDGKWYYLYGDGSLALSTVINGYIVDENGVWENR